MSAAFATWRVRAGVTKEQLAHGVRLKDRAFPLRTSLVLNNVTVQEGSNAIGKGHIFEVGEIRFPNGEVRTLGRGPAFHN